MNDQDTSRTPQDKACAYEYTVKRGDSFYLIAHRLGVPLRDLLAANEDINPARLMVGDVLCIPLEEDDAPQVPAEPAPTPSPEPAVPEAPAPEAATPEAPEPVTPETPAPAAQEELPDDLMGTLDQPAAPGQGPAPEDIFVCPVAERHVLQDGETVTDVQLEHSLSWHTLESANPGVDLAATTTGQELCVPEENIACPLPLTYTLQSGDTIESVAIRYEVSVGALLRANPCLAPADFYEGVTVTLPQ